LFDTVLKMTLSRGKSCCGQLSVKILESRPLERRSHCVSTKVLKSPSPTPTRFTLEKLLAYTRLKLKDRNIFLFVLDIVHNFTYLGLLTPKIRSWLRCWSTGNCTLQVAALACTSNLESKTRESDTMLVSCIIQYAM